ncbi:MAG: ketoacyl-ACP synthase III [Pseudomonadota bacterium]
MRIRIVGTGRALPENSVPSTAIDAEVGLAAGSLQAATGVAERYVCDGESQIDLALAACRNALSDGGVDPSEVGLIVSGSSVPYQPLPATAPLVMGALGIADGRAAAFDVNSTCLGFLTAFEVAARQIEGGQSDMALVFCADIASRALPFDDDPETAALFGDGAAAAVIRRAKAGRCRVRATLMRTYPSAYECCSIGSGGTRFDFRHESEDFARHAVFRMDGKKLFRMSSLHFKDFVTDLLDAAGWTRESVDLVVPHQASPFALAHMAKQVGFEPERLVDITETHGNQVAASIPFALDLARREGRIRPGSRVLFLGTSAGVSFGGMALET